MLEFLAIWIKDNLRRQEGQAMAEYGIILALIAAICVGAIVFLGQYINDAFNTIVSAIKPSSGS